MEAVGEGWDYEAAHEVRLGARKGEERKLRDKRCEMREGEER